MIVWLCLLSALGTLLPHSAKNDVDQAVKYLSAKFGEVLIEEENVFALLVAAPELIRYSYFQNFLETAGLELLYVQYGADGADFSIGPFQMKPSFIEELEQQVLGNPVLIVYRSIAAFPTDESNRIREIRINRIQQPKFQLLYLSAFRAYCEYQFAGYLGDATTKEKLRFIATAYNMGFGHSNQDILDYMQQKNFPYGANYPGTQYAYGQLAVDIYQALIQNRYANSKTQ